MLLDMAPSLQDSPSIAEQGVVPAQPTLVQREPRQKPQCTLPTMANLNLQLPSRRLPV